MGIFVIYLFMEMYFDNLPVFWVAGVYQNKGHFRFSVIMQAMKFYTGWNKSNY